MTRILGILAAVGLVGGCSVFGDEPPLLLGAWGGPNMLVVGTPAGATVQMTCNRATFAGPLRLDQPSGYTATGQFAPDFWLVGSIGAPARIVVTFVRDTAFVKVQTLYNGQWGGNRIFPVVLGQPITYPDGQTCVA
jgi:hypothetical protein